MSWGQTSDAQDNRVLPPVSVIIPCRNESAFIDETLRLVLGQDYPNLIEVLIAEGCSSDDTRGRLLEWEARDRRVRVVNNPEGIVPTGLNRAVRLARGDVIVRMDAHSWYASDYVTRCVEVLQATGADNVGGPAVIGGEAPLQRAFALAAGSRLTLGGARSKEAGYEGPVDTVQYGCWRRATLLAVGLFDEALVRNQDDELNFRIRKGGGVVWQSPAIRSNLQARDSLVGLFRQYWQYGYWKLQVMLKHGRPASVRHLVPAAFVLSLSLLLAATPLVPAAGWILAGLLAIYLALLTVEGARLTPGQRRLFPLVLVVIPTVHLAYGLGLIVGLWDRLTAGGQPREAASKAVR